MSADERDPLLAAVEAVATALSPLDLESREWVLKWVGLGMQVLPGGTTDAIVQLAEHAKRYEV